MSGQEAKVYPNVSIDGRQAVIERHRAGAAHGNGNSGMADVASSSFPSGRRASASFSFPIRDGQWRGCVAEPLTGKDRYASLGRNQTKQVYSDVCIKSLGRDPSWREPPDEWRMKRDD